MADLKISQLTGATTPLAGTEVLPIVQSGATKKATIANIVGAGTSPGSFTGVTSTAAIGVISQTAAGSAGYVQVSGTANYQIFGGPFIGGTVVEAAAGGVYTKVAGSNITAATSSGLEITTGNLIQGTAAKGVNFTANTPAAGMTSQLLNWYEEGTFTPKFSTTGTDFSSVTYSTQVGTYTRIGNVVYIVVQLTVSALTAGSPTGDLVVAGYPFTINATYTPVLSIGLAGAFTTNVPSVAQARANNTMSRLYYRAASNGGLSAMSPSELTSTSTVVLSGFYFV